MKNRENHIGFDAQNNPIMFRRDAQIVLESIRAVRASETAATPNLVFELSFSSDTPIRRYSWWTDSYYYEVLDHSEDAVDLAYLQATGAVLRNHDSEDLVGVVERAWIENGKCKAQVRLASDEAALALRIEEGIVRNVSVGYTEEAWVIESEVDGVRTYRITKWVPREISFVSMPADETVGVGRSLQPVNPIEERAMRTATTAPGAGITETAQPSVTPEQERRAAVRQEIREFAEAVGESDLVPDFLLDERDLNEHSLDRFRNHARSVRSQRQAAQPATPTAVRAEQRAHTEPTFSTRSRMFRGSNDWRENSKRALGFARFLQSQFMQGEAQARAHRYCVENGILATRSMTESSGDFSVLLPPEFLPDFIDNVEQYGALRSNCRVRNITSESAIIRTKSRGMKFYPAGEIELVADSQLKYAPNSVDPKKWVALAEMSSELDEDSSISMADDIMDDLAYAQAVTEDETGFLGDGSGSYNKIVGILKKLRNPELKGTDPTIANVSGLYVGSGNAYSELVLADFLGLVGTLPEYADRNAKWYVSRSFALNVMTKIALAAGGVTGNEIVDGVARRFLGYPIVIVHAMPKIEANSQICAVFGDMFRAAQLIDRKRVEITSSAHVKFKEGAVVIRAETRWDFLVPDAGNVTATASARKPGPLVGLITAAS